MIQDDREVLEMQMIGCCLRDEAFCIESSQEISEESFLYPRTHKLFKAVKKITNSGQSVNESSASREAADDLFTFPEAISFSVECSHISSSVRFKDVVEVFKEQVALYRLKSLAQKVVSFENNGNGSVLRLIDSVKHDVASIEVNRSCEILDPLASMLNHEDGKSFEEILKLRIKDFKSGNGKIPGISFGIPTLDRLTGGIGRGEVILLGARTGMGKTQFAVDLLRHWSNAGIPVAMFSMEMTVAQLNNRFISQISSVPTSRLDEGNMTSMEEESVMKAIDLYKKLNISFCDKSGLRPSDIKSHLYKMKAKNDVKIAVIDFLTLMNSDRKSSNNHEKYGDIIKDLQEIAKTLQISLFILVQLNRANEREKEPPTKTDIKESSAIPEAANTILFLHRDDYYTTGSSNGDVSLVLDKTRSRGCRHLIPMRFDRLSGRYFEKQNQR